MPSAIGPSLHSPSPPCSQTLHPPKAKAREAHDLAVRVSPLTGVIPPFGTAQLVVSFCPPPSGQVKGFELREPESEDTARAFDYVVQVKMAVEMGSEKRFRDGRDNRFGRGACFEPQGTILLESADTGSSNRYR
jgi:hypothetical protein